MWMRRRIELGKSPVKCGDRMGAQEFVFGEPWDKRISNAKEARAFILALVGGSIDLGHQKIIQTQTSDREKVVEGMASPVVRGWREPVSIGTVLMISPSHPPRTRALFILGRQGGPERGKGNSSIACSLRRGLAVVALVEGAQEGREAQGMGRQDVGKETDEPDNVRKMPERVWSRGWGTVVDGTAKWRSPEPATSYRRQTR